MIIINGKVKERKILFIAIIFVNLKHMILNLSNKNKVTYIKLVNEENLF
jgi:hypothetical protein